MRFIEIIVIWSTETVRYHQWISNIVARDARAKPVNLV